MPTNQSISKTGLIIALLSLAFSSGCNKRQEIADAPPRDIVHTVQEHGVTITLTLTPGIIDPREDALLSLQTRFPAGSQMDFPQPASALEGFTVAAVLSPPDTRDQAGHHIRETVLRLTPIPGSNYRVAPMLFTITPNADNKAESRYLITPAIRPPTKRRTGTEETGLTTQPAPIYIPPTPAEVLQWTILTLCIIACLAFLYVLLRKVRRQIQILRMSPGERARHELQRLLEQDLPGKGQYKAFYFAITSIIRTYIERRHGIRAPELTTPEFLAAAAVQPAFKPAVVEKLKRFLESADLVKFAAWMPTGDAIRDTIATARHYIDEDEPSQEPGKD
jgi:hypothetical protein